MRQRLSYIHAVVAKWGASFIFQTQKGVRTPFSATINGMAAELAVQKIDPQEPRAWADFWNKRGWGYYLWTPPKPSIRPGDMATGIVVKKV